MAEYYESLYCQWAEDGSLTYSEGWETECGNRFVLTEGTPTENDMKYCCYCGRQLVEVQQEDGADE